MSEMTEATPSAAPAQPLAATAAGADRLTATSPRQPPSGTASTTDSCQAEPVVVRTLQESPATNRLPAARPVAAPTTSGPRVRAVTALESPG